MIDENTRLADGEGRMAKGERSEWKHESEASDGWQWAVVDPGII